MMISHHRMRDNDNGLDRVIVCILTHKHHKRHRYHLIQPMVIQEPFPVPDKDSGSSRRRQRSRSRERAPVRVPMYTVDESRSSQGKKDMTTGKLAHFKRGSISCVRSLLEDDANSPLLQRDCTERFEGRLAFDARLRGNPRLYGRFLGDFFAKGLITVGTAMGRVAPFVVPKKDGRQQLMFDTREAKHHFAPPPYTPLASNQSLSSLKLLLGTTLFRGPG